MTRKVQIVAAVLAAAAVAGWWFWRQNATPEREVRKMLEQLAAEFNASTTDG